MLRAQLTPTRVKITKAFVDRVEHPVTGQEYFYDTELKGFLLCVGKERKTYYVEKTIRGTGKAARIWIGHHGPNTPDQMRQKAMRYLAMMGEGIDPRAEERRRVEEQQAAERVQLTLNQLWEMFKDDRKHFLRPNSIYQYGKYMATAFGGGKGRKTGFTFEDWRQRPIGEISRDEVFRYHRLLGEKSGRYYANAAMEILNDLLNFAVKRGRLDKNPCEVLQGEYFAEERREETIPEDRLADLFKAVDDVRTGAEEESVKACADYLEFLLFTGARKEEGGQLRWENVDWTKKTVTFPETKNGKNHTLPITDHIITLLLRRKVVADKIGSPWVFPSLGKRKSKEGFLTDPRVAKERVETKLGMPFRLHDLRRTFSTFAHAMVPYPVVVMLMNHSTKGNVTLGYNQPSPEDRIKRMREGMETLTSFFLDKKAAGQGMKLAVAQ